MKILQVIPFFNPKRGGAISVCYDLSKELCKLGHEVTIITTDFEYDQRYVQSLQHIEVLPFKCVTNLKLLLYSPEMEKWLRSNVSKYDVIHLHDVRTYQNCITCKYAKAYGIPYVIQPHGALPRMIEKKCLKYLYDRVWGHSILRSAERVIALTAVEAEQSIRFGIDASRVRIIANGIDLSQYEDIPLPGDFRRIYNISLDTHIILYLGRLHPIKGVDLLIRAFGTLSQEIDDCVLVIVGPDEGFLPELKSITKDLDLCSKVIFTGPLYGRSKAAAYYDSDVYVLPSRYEAFPMTILEAWAFKKPVIVTEKCGIKDLIQNAGMVVRLEQHDLVKAMEDYLRQDCLRHDHGQNGYDKVYADLSLQKTVKNIETMYQGLIK